MCDVAQLRYHRRTIRGLHNWLAELLPFSVGPFMRRALCSFGLWGLALVACSSNHDVADGGHDTVLPAGCGDGIKNNAEACDGTDLGSATCATATAPGWTGVVSCTSTCDINVAGCNPPTTAWKAITDAANWSTFDLGTLFPGAKGYATSVFDGKFLYLIPSNNGAPDGVVTRYDTTGGFGASGSWSTFDVSTVNAAAKGFGGGAFDGKYLYLVPYNNGAYDGVIARYDTTATFGDSNAWAAFDLSTVDPNARGYIRSVFDGRYLYLVPHYNGAYHGTVARFDSQNPAGFTGAAAWSTFDIGAVNVHLKGFLGGTFDGRYLYLAPYYDGTAYDGVVARYDSQSTTGFADAGSWTYFDLATVNPNGVGYYSITFDGRYVYLGQYYDGTAMVPNYGGVMARYDTQATFSAGSSWQTFDVSSINANARGFIGATYDGRFVYFSPHYNGAYDGIVTRFDTTAGGFASPASWSMFDTSTLSASGVGFAGAGFDGKYVYMIPNTNATTALGVVVRFESKSPSWMPRGWSVAFD
jgi:antitoxin component YwqK of YwqJK toxin-antitoxin module